MMELAIEPMQTARERRRTAILGAILEGSTIFVAPEVAERLARWQVYSLSDLSSILVSAPVALSNYMGWSAGQLAEVRAEVELLGGGPRPTARPKQMPTGALRRLKPKVAG